MRPSDRCGPQFTPAGRNRQRLGVGRCRLEQSAVDRDRPGLTFNAPSSVVVKDSAVPTNKITYWTDTRVVFYMPVFDTPGDVSVKVKTAEGAESNPMTFELRDPGP